MQKALRSIGTALAVAIALATAGCSTLLAVGDQHALIDANAVAGGKIETAGYEARGPLVVGLVARGPDGLHVVDHFVAEKPGSWVIAVAPGTYWVVAFEDADGNGRYDDEPAYRPEDADTITLAPGQRRTDINLRIPKSGRFRRMSFSLEDVELRPGSEQQTRSLFALSAVGEQASLDDPRFAETVASGGMWKPYEFLLKSRPGIYFLEPYDPKRIPVLFVHGVGGTPINFREMIANIDRERFQVWVAYYPSGGKLDSLAAWLTQLFTRLRTQYHFERAAVVAHSMGGLVSRAFVLGDYEASGTKSVRTFVTISSPLGGMDSAGKGIERSPVIIRSWYGLAPGSDFLDGLFYSDIPARKVRRTLPEHMAYHMMFGYRGESGDGIVTIASQLRMEAQQDARSLRGFDATHNGILADPAASVRLNEILAEMK